jgi:hypothetical protein
LFFLAFFSAFSGVSRQGQFKNTITIFLQKGNVENFSQNNRQNFRCHFFLGFFCFIAVSGVSQRWEFKNTTKNVLQKKSCRKVFYKKFDQKPKTDFFSIVDVSPLKEQQTRRRRGGGAARARGACSRRRRPPPLSAPPPPASPLNA